MVVDPGLEASLRAKYEATLPHLDERARRVVLGGDARWIGYGGIGLVARAAGVDAKMVSRGVALLDSGADPLPPGRTRAPGGGRKALETADPQLVTALLALVEPTRRGDPESVLSWTTLSTRKLAGELAGQGWQVSHEKTAQLLRANGFSLQANAKTVEGNQHPDRDAQFCYINDRASEHTSAGEPVISVDTKKKELVGDFKNNGAEWRPAGDPEKVRVHDFKDPVLGKVNPYGIYDIAADQGWVSVGTDHDTAQFAVNTIRTWWHTTGSLTYPNATRLLITADGGGSNAYRTRLWKTELVALAAETGLAITVCHFPPGTSKWNKIEHRLFSYISMNWRGRPLTSHEVILNTIAATTTTTGLTVHAELDTNDYPTGIEISPATMKTLRETGIHQPHHWHSEWNYTINPNTPT